MQVRRRVWRGRGWLGSEATCKRCGSGAGGPLVLTGVVHVVVD